MLLQPTLKAWCWCLASLGPLTIKRGAFLSAHGLLLASGLRDKGVRSWMKAWQSIGGFHPHVGNETLHLTRFKHLFSKRRGIIFLVAVGYLFFHFQAQWSSTLEQSKETHHGGDEGPWDFHSLSPSGHQKMQQTTKPVFLATMSNQADRYAWDHWRKTQRCSYLTAKTRLQHYPSTVSRGLLQTRFSPS